MVVNLGSKCSSTQRLCYDYAKPIETQNVWSLCNCIVKALVRYGIMDDIQQFVCFIRPLRRRAFLVLVYFLFSLFLLFFGTRKSVSERSVSAPEGAGDFCLQKSVCL